MSKEGFIIESQRVLKKYEGKIVNESLDAIRSDLNDALNEYLSNNVVMDTDFPVTYENEFGKWEMRSDGTTIYQPKSGTQYIECNITISKTGDIDESEE